MEEFFQSQPVDATPQLPPVGSILPIEVRMRDHTLEEMRASIQERLHDGQDRYSVFNRDLLAKSFGSWTVHAVCVRCLNHMDKHCAALNYVAQGRSRATWACGACSLDSTVHQVYSDSLNWWAHHPIPHAVVRSREIVIDYRRQTWREKVLSVLLFWRPPVREAVKIVQYEVLDVVMPPAPPTPVPHPVRPRPPQPPPPPPPPPVETPLPKPRPGAPRPKSPPSKGRKKK